MATGRHWHWVISRSDDGGATYRYIRPVADGCPTWTEPCVGAEVPEDAMRFAHMSVAETYAKPLREHGWDCEIVQVKTLRGSTEMGVSQ